MEWHVNPEWRTPHAVKPWSESKSEYRAEPIHYGDVPEAISACLSCNRPTCNGDCFNRIQATAKTSTPTNKKGVDVKKIVRLYLSGLSTVEVAESIGVSRATIKYWIRKTNTKRPVKEKKPSKPEADPCWKCRNAYLCKTRNWTCSEKIKWESR